MLRIASIGECMVELSESAEAGAPAAGRMQRTFGGDTLNTAVYLARCLRQSAAQPPATVHPAAVHPARSEEHTSELQSLMRISYAVFCLKKKKNKAHR